MTAAARLTALNAFSRSGSHSLLALHPYPFGLSILHGEHIIRFCLDTVPISAASLASLPDLQLDG